MNRAGAIVACAMLLCAPPASATSITTLAGNGLPGFVDGPARDASFVFPAGIAYDPTTKGLYIADAGAQRIRLLSAAGIVSTVAGGGALEAGGLWVAGAYVDGPALQARFNDPRALAVDKNQTIYVADTGNHCVRKIAGGVVTTFAHFPEPTGIAVDSGGNVYVADPTVGLTKLDAAGNATVLHYARSPISVAVRDGVKGPTLYLADGQGVLVVPPSAPTSRYGAFAIDPSTAPGTISDRTFEGLDPVGSPFAISAFGTNAFVFTDARLSLARFVDDRLGRMELLAGGYSETNMAETAGLRDGAGDGSLLNVPMGVAAAGAGTVAIADSGNRRIRVIHDVDARDAIVPVFGLLPSTDFTPQDYKIAYMGNSIVWFDNSWDNSIQGMIEARLRNDLGLRRAHNTVKVVPVWGVAFPTNGGIREYMNEAGTSWANMVVYQVNWGSVYYYALEFGKKPDNDPVTHQPEVWRPPFVAGLRKLKHLLDANHIPLLVVLQPTAGEISPIEIAQTRFSLGNYTPDDRALRMLRQAIARSGVHWIDLSADFIRDLRSPKGYPLFGTDDPHLAPRGRELIADAVARELARMQPWAHM